MTPFKDLNRREVKLMESERGTVISIVCREFGSLVGRSPKMDVERVQRLVDGLTEWIAAQPVAAKTGTDQ